MRILFAIALVLSGCSGVDGANGTDGGGGSGGAGGSGGGPADGLPCDVHALLQQRCQGCHSSPPSQGAPMSLMTRADLMAQSIADPTKTFAEIAVIRMNSPEAPMPPPPNARATADEIMALQNWIAAGYPADTCGGGTP